MFKKILVLFLTLTLLSGCMNSRHVASFDLSDGVGGLYSLILNGGSIIGNLMDAGGITDSSNSSNSGSGIYDYYDTDKRDDYSNNNYYDNNSYYQSNYSYYNLYFLETVKIRNGAGTDYDHIGQVKKGSELHAYSTNFRNGYTWYEIGLNQWVADDGAWISCGTYSSDSPVNYGAYNYYELFLNSDTSIYSSPYDSWSSGYLTERSRIYAYESKMVDGYTWYQISFDQWIPNYGDIDVTYH